MSMFDTILQQVGGPDRLSELASTIGLTEEQAAMAMKALGHAHKEPGDTVQGAAQKSGLPQSKLQEILNQIGGEEMLGKIAGFLDRDGDGNPLNDLSGMANQFLGKK